MKKFLVDETQKNEILSMHKSLMKEQAAPATYSSADEQILRKSIQAGCLKDGKLRTDKNKTRIIYRSTTKSGKIVDFFPDMTYKFQDGSKTGRWKCDQAQTIITNDQETQAKIETLKKQNWKTLEELKTAGVDLNTLDKTHEKTVVGTTTLYRPVGGKTVHHSNTSTAEFNQEQQSFIDKFVALGYVLNPTRVEQQSMVAYTDKQLNAPPDLFPNGLTMWYDPNKQKLITKDDSVLSDIIKNQSIDRKACKKNIEDYYTAYTRRKSFQVSASEIEKAKRVVQACKDQYYGEWPALSGGKKLDRYLDVLSGNVSGGPSGEYANFKLK